MAENEHGPPSEDDDGPNDGPDGPNSDEGERDGYAADNPDRSGEPAAARSAADAGFSAPSGLLIAAVVSLLALAAMYFTFQPSRAGERSVVLIPLGSYAVLGVATVALLWRRGEISARLMPFRGDVTIGALSAGVLYMVALVSTSALMPVGSPRAAWLMRLYLHLGDPRDQSPLMLGLSVLLAAALEELVWRGLVMRALFDVVSEGRAVLLTALLYALAHATTLFQLGDPLAGPNPLLVAAAAGGGLVWGAIAWRFGRLPPAILAHALFSWAIVEFPLWHL